MAIRKGFLVFPAYIMGVLIACAAGNLLPPLYGLSIAAVLVLAMLTPLSLLHPKLDTEWFMQIVLYLGVLFVAWEFASRALPADIGPQISNSLSWLQVGFVAVQQALYFGIHAFCNPKTKER